LHRDPAESLISFWPSGILAFEQIIHGEFASTGEVSAKAMLFTESPV